MREDQIFDARERDLAFVPRWTITRNIRPQSVAEHSYYVTLWAMRIAEFLNWNSDEKFKLTKRAMLHDMPEVFSGDLPSPFKKTLGEGKNAETFYLLLKNPPENKELFRFDADCDEIIKFCDLVEALVKICEEKSMGNKTLQGCYNEVYDKMLNVAISIEAKYLLPEETMSNAVMAMIFDTLNYQSGIAMKKPEPISPNNSKHDDEVPF